MDLELNDNHDLAVRTYDIHLVSDTDLMKQRLRQSLWFFMGEWYLDTTDGVPYYRDILKKAPDRITVESVIKQAIMETPGTIKLEQFDVQYDNPVRKFSVTFKVSTIYGNISFSEDLI